MLVFSSSVTILAWAFTAFAILGSIYQLLAAFAVRRLAGQPRVEPKTYPAVTLIKPLCGDEPQLYENLRSFCRLDYPALQIVFGVRTAGDPAAAVVRRLQAELPDADIALVENPALYGANYKISNVINIMSAAKHDVLILSDSDMHIDGAYLEAVVGGLSRPGTGLVTCLYIGVPTKGLWSELGAAGINYGFLPSATVSKFLGGKTGCYGATIALTRSTLESVGGFAALKDQLADDYALGALVREGGQDVSVIPYFLETTVDEPTFTALFRHELRWARTIRNTEALGFAASAIIHPVPWAVLALICGSVAGLPRPMLFITLMVTVICRLTLVGSVLRSLATPKPRWWLLLPRDVLSLAILVLAFCGRSVSWRNSAFRVDSAGALSTEIDGI
jgi:ceramide glucosyltransferase